MLPKDNVMLLSFVNMKLRDFCPTLEDFCAEYQISEEELKARLATVDYYYSKEQNQFI